MVLFRRSNVQEPTPPDWLVSVVADDGKATRSGLIFTGVGELSPTQLRKRPVLDPTPGTAVCISTEIHERQVFPDFDTACYCLQVEVAFILSRTKGKVLHQATVMQNVTEENEATEHHSFVPTDSGGIASRALKARLNAISRQLKQIDFGGLRLQQVVNKVRNDVWLYIDGPDCSPSCGSYTVKVTYLN